MAEPAEKAEETEPFQHKDEVDYHPANSKAEQEPLVDQRLRIRVIILVVAVLVLVAVFFTVGYVTHMVAEPCTRPPPPSIIDKLVQDATENISTSKIEEQLRYFTSKPHVGGSTESKEQAEYIQKEWQNYGLDRVELKKYDVLLSFPKQPGLARIVDDKGAEIFRARQKEKALLNDEKDDRVLPPFNAFSASGNVTASLVFVNYARLEDFRKLKELGISVAGHIVIAKYGKNFPGHKEKLARNEGAVGLILYTDPKDSNPGVSLNDTYPKTWWLPSSGVRRDTLFVGNGDLETPGYPSIDGMYRAPVDHSQLPQLPVYPVSADDAKRFLELLTGTKAPADWQGGLPITYNINRNSSSTNGKVNLYVDMELVTKPVYNVMGVLKGDVEPDRMVIFGNHRDAWTFGATDPSSGTAVLMETVRVIARMRKVEKDWRPRRTMVFMSWGGEEHGTIGSIEWVEDFANLIKNRAVAYLNCDTAVTGNYTFRTASSPLIDFAMFEVTKKVFTPNGSAMDFVYDDWKLKNPDKINPSIPQTSKISPDSDHKGFIERLGIPSADFSYTWNSKKMNINYPPVYHTLHDTFHWVSNFLDRGFHFHRTVAQVWVRLGVLLTESNIIPFNCSRYAEKIASHVKDFKKEYGKKLEDQTIKLDHLDFAVKNLTTAAKEFHRFLSSKDLNNPFDIRMANDRLVHFEKSFINPQGIPGKPFTRHMIYAGATFPGVVDSINVAKNDSTKWNEVKKQVSLLVYYIRSATQILSTQDI